MLHNSLEIIYLVPECVTRNITFNNREPKSSELYSKSSINIRHVTVLFTNMCMDYSMVPNCVFLHRETKAKIIARLLGQKLE